MLIEPRFIHAPPQFERKPPYHIVAQLSRTGGSHFLKYIGVSDFAMAFGDGLQDLSPRIYEAGLFCHLKDATTLAKKCAFTCNCGQIHSTGAVLEVTPSGLNLDGIHYGTVQSYHNPDLAIDQRLAIFYKMWSVRIVKEWVFTEGSQPEPVFPRSPDPFEEEATRFRV